MLTPLNRLLPSLLGGDVAVLGCQVPLDSVFVLSFRRRLIMKLPLHRVLIDCLPMLDAVELGGFSLRVLGSHTGIMLFPFQSESYCSCIADVVIATLVSGVSC